MKFKYDSVTLQQFKAIHNFCIDILITAWQQQHSKSNYSINKYLVHLCKYIFSVSTF